MHGDKKIKLRSICNEKEIPWGLLKELCKPSSESSRQHPAD